MNWKIVSLASKSEPLVSFHVYYYLLQYIICFAHTLPPSLHSSFISQHLSILAIVFWKLHQNIRNHRGKAIEVFFFYFVLNHLTLSILSLPRFNHCGSLRFVWNVYIFNDFQMVSQHLHIEQMFYASKATGTAHCTLSFSLNWIIKFIIVCYFDLFRMKYNT